MTYGGYVKCFCQDKIYGIFPGDFNLRPHGEHFNIALN